MQNAILNLKLINFVKRSADRIVQVYACVVHDRFQPLQLYGSLGHREYVFDGVEVWAVHRVEDALYG